MCGNGNRVSDRGFGGRILFEAASVSNEASMDMEKGLAEKYPHTRLAYWKQLSEASHGSCSL